MAWGLTRAAQQLENLSLKGSAKHDLNNWETKPVWLNNVYTEYANMSQKLPEESSVKAELTAAGGQGYWADYGLLF